MRRQTARKLPSLAAVLVAGVVLGLVVQIMPARGAEQFGGPSAASNNAAPPQHPLKPAVDMAYAAMRRCEEVDGYTYTFVKRERIKGKLVGHEFLYMKIRHEPFSVYAHCLGPLSPKGQEAIYVEGHNDDMVLAHGTGIKALVGTVELAPNDDRMLEGSRHPITEAGIKNLLKKVTAMYEYESSFGECDVRFLEGAKVDDRVCTCVQVMHPVPRRNFKYHVSRVYFDQQLGLPIRWEAYDWPKQSGGQPVLLEEYTYRNLQFDIRLTDADFDPGNPKYLYR